MYGGERSTGKGVVDIKNIDSDFKNAIEMFPELANLISGSYEYYYEKEPWTMYLIAIGKKTLSEQELCLANFALLNKGEFVEWAFWGLDVSKSGFDTKIFSDMEYGLYFNKSITHKTVIIDAGFSEDGTVVLVVKIIRTREIIDKDGNPI